MVPSGVHDTVRDPKVERSRAYETRGKDSPVAVPAGDGDGPSSSPDGGGVDADVDVAGQRQQKQERRGRRSRKRSSSGDVVLDSRTKIKRRVKNLLMKMRVDQNLLDAYSGEGWKGQSREKIRPEQELRRAEARILHSKLAIREAIHELDNLGLEGSLEENVFDAEGRVYHEEIFCAKCKSHEDLLDNDIILCDGACNRGFHQYCLDPPLATINIPPGDEGWLCPTCECKMECVEVINAYLNTSFEVENSWEVFFSKEALRAAGVGPQEGADGDFPSSDSEDDDYDPEGMEIRANSGNEGEGSQGGKDRVAMADGDFPSSDSEDDDYDPEAMETHAKSGSEGEGNQGGKDREDGAEGDFPSSDSEDDDYDPEGMETLVKSGSDAEGIQGGEDREAGEDSDSDSSGDENSASENDEQAPSDAINLSELANGGKRSGSSKEGSGGSQVSDSDNSDTSLFDEFNDGDETLGLRRGGSQAELSVSDEEAIVIGGKRHRKALDYKRLNDEMFGNAETEDDNIFSEDEDWGPQRRRRRTTSDDPNRPRPPRVRRKRVPSGDALHEVVAQGERAADNPGDTFREGDAQGEGAADTPGAPGDALHEVDAQVEGATDSPGEKRVWRRLPDSAVEALRLVVAVNTLPSKSRKEELATQLGLSFAQVHGWFKNQRHRALRKGLVSYKRPHLVPSRSEGANGIKQVDAPGATIFLNENSSNAYLAAKLDEVATTTAGAQANP